MNCAICVREPVKVGNAAPFLDPEVLAQCTSCPNFACLEHMYIDENKPFCEDCVSYWADAFVGFGD